MPHKSTVVNRSNHTYAQLRQRVKEALLLGRQTVEEAKVQTYLKTGQLINEHILKNISRKENYGKEVIEKLAEDLDVSSSVLWRCVRFAHSFKKILARGPESFPKHLVWSHYRKLITVPDENSRLSFMQRAEKGGWSAEELGGKIQMEIGREDSGESDGKLESAKKDSKPFPKLIPKKGILYAYRLIAPDSVHEKEDDRLWIDLGFQVHRKIPLGSRGLKENQIVESFRSEAGDYSMAASKRTKDSLFTYKAFVERVVDADTLIVKIDLGFETRIRQYLRLRGINAPEISAPEGKKARDFVERALSKVSHVVLSSFRSDKYDRYLADIFYGDLNKEIYLNQLLLDEGLAERMG